MPDKKSTTNITSFSTETRVFPPSKEFSKRAHIKSLAHYRKLHHESLKSPEETSVIVSGPSLNVVALLKSTATEPAAALPLTPVVPYCQRICLRRETWMTRWFP